MSEEEKKAIKTVEEDIEVYKQKGLWKENSILVKSLRIILKLITKQQNKINNVKTRLEYYLIGNMSFNEEAQEEFKKLLKLLEE